MWVQWDDPPGGAVFDELPGGGVVDGPPGGGVVDEPLAVSVVTDVELVEVGVVEDELLVAALATAAPPPTRTPASPTTANVCRSRIFISSQPFASAPSGRRSRISGSEDHFAACP
jgi:hypothetical protein